MINGQKSMMSVCAFGVGVTALVRFTTAGAVTPEPPFLVGRSRGRPSVQTDAVVLRKGALLRSADDIRLIGHALRSDSTSSKVGGFHFAMPLH